MISKLILVILALLCASCTTLSDKTHLAALADTTSTIIAINSGHLEANPILGQSTINIVVVGIVKYFLIEQLKNTDSKEALRILYSLYSGTAVNNTLIILGLNGPLPIIIGIASGYILYKQEN